jgi:hypothetical protein
MRLVWHAASMLPRNTFISSLRMNFRAAASLSRSSRRASELFLSPGGGPGVPDGPGPRGCTLNNGGRNLYDPKSHYNLRFYPISLMQP